MPIALELGHMSGKGKEKEKKDLSRQTTLFGLPSKPPAEKQAKLRKKAVEAVEVDDTSAPKSQIPVADIDMPEALPPPSEDATLVETQDTDKMTMEETQPLEDDEIPIPWAASPPPTGADDEEETIEN
jgi:chromosome transmission fidelity protein 4